MPKTYDLLAARPDDAGNILVLDVGFSYYIQVKKLMKKNELNQSYLAIS